MNGTTTKYYLEGSKVVYEKTGDNLIYYSYDESGNLIGLKYNDTQYWYIRNGQNDIVGILDNNLKQVVSYTYDSWGNIISIKDNNGNNITDSNNIGLINSYRYRGYRYDVETGLYYLNSRYYNPQWGRFINADSYGGATGGLLTHNVYAYCLNNPTNMKDSTGFAPGDLFDSIDAAARDFALNYNGSSIAMNKEFASAIYQVKVKTKVVTPMIITYFGHWYKINLVTTKVTIKYSYTKPKIGTSSNVKVPSAPITKTKVGTVHTHGAYDLKFPNAERLASAHEYGKTDKSVYMDLANNEVGRNIGKIYISEEDEFKRAKKEGYATSEISGSRDSYTFYYLDKPFTINSYSNSYDIMSDMILHAIDQGKLTWLE